MDLSTKQEMSYFILNFPSEFEELKLAFLQAKSEYEAFRFPEEFGEKSNPEKLEILMIERNLQMLSYRTKDDIHKKAKEVFLQFLDTLKTDLDRDLEAVGIKVDYTGRY